MYKHLPLLHIHTTGESLLTLASVKVWLESESENGPNWIYRSGFILDLNVISRNYVVASFPVKPVSSMTFKGLRQSPRIQFVFIWVCPDPLPRWKFIET